MIGLGLPVPSVLPDPDGAIDQGDRQQFAFLYAGVVVIVGGPFDVQRAAVWVAGANVSELQLAEAVASSLVLAGAVRGVVGPSVLAVSLSVGGAVVGDALSQVIATEQSGGAASPGQVNAGALEQQVSTGRAKAAASYSAGAVVAQVHISGSRAGMADV